MRAALDVGSLREANVEVAVRGIVGRDEEAMSIDISSILFVNAC